MPPRSPPTVICCQDNQTDSGMILASEELRRIEQQQMDPVSKMWATSANPRTAQASVLATFLSFLTLIFENFLPAVVLRSTVCQRQSVNISFKKHISNCQTQGKTVFPLSYWHHQDESCGDLLHKYAKLSRSDSWCVLVNTLFIAIWEFEKVWNGNETNLKTYKQTKLGLRLLMKTHTRALLCVILWHLFHCSKMLFSVLSTAAWAAAAARSPWQPLTVPWIETTAPVASDTVPASSASFQDRPSTIMNMGTCQRMASVTSSRLLMPRACRPPPICELCKWCSQR